MKSTAERAGRKDTTLVIAPETPRESPFFPKTNHFDRSWLSKLSCTLRHKLRYESWKHTISPSVTIASCMVAEGTIVTLTTERFYPPPHQHTPTTLLPMPCNPITLPTNPPLLNHFYHPPLALVSILTPTPWPMVFIHTPPTPPAPAPAAAPAQSPSDKKGNRQKGNKKDKKGQRPPKAKTGTPNTV